MPEITCPDCGLVVAFESIRRAAEEFCPHCDYPLFWAPSNVPVAVSSVGSDATLRRLPGAGGRLLIGTRVCPVCGEHNHLAAAACIRCGSDMEPKEPEPVREPEPVLLQIPPPPSGTKKRLRWWPWAVAAAVIVLTVVIVIALA